MNHATARASAWYFCTQQVTKEQLASIEKRKFNMEDEYNVCRGVSPKASNTRAAFEKVKPATDPTMW